MKSKAALIDNLSMVLERKGIVLPRPEVFPELVDELEAFQFSVTDSGNGNVGFEAAECSAAVEGATRVGPPFPRGSVVVHEPLEAQSINFKRGIDEGTLGEF